MKKILLSVAIATAALATAAPAMARDGCGGGWYRAYDGRCYPMGRTVVVERPVFGGYYGHGYWGGRPYWGYHHYWHRGWGHRW
ncbi:putative membrane protein [Novosphingobium capsulatum]|uniref:Membrane protein n=1 Tax=Novosphingobium capsulatum TaxID=13688 RepID=A0ABU1MIT5_9SPHN|nr:MULTISPECIES: hypothetical protein [Novosphingobium]KPF56582.1 hypothetical protein IP65_02015 [Novosphingobium sp. AAP1]MBB3356776.1 putative membrane protein [Novosphingobium sp. BK256]MBB3373177.1 putative membrane protein [Novosphingobium sp. BK280]MBB3377546.1 putative membrane protein [Novosphingobium sp. BK258]MBB3419043.1 putative membrane protein [Novosphingobium sp. BK267]